MPFGALKRLALLGALSSCLVLPQAAGAAAGAGKFKPVLSMLSTCAQLTPRFYPADTTTWFEASKDPQVVFFAHLLFPLNPAQDSLEAFHPLAPPLSGPWHPPMVIPLEAQPQSFQLNDVHYAQAQWLDPDGAELALFGLTMPARVSSDYIHLGDKQYIPHTFSMALGTKDIRPEAGQKSLPSKPGQYHIRLYVDGDLEAIAFFRMLPSNAPAQLPKLGMEGALPESLSGSASGESMIKDMLKVLTQTAK
jgi:hypothetical protein